MQGYAQELMFSGRGKGNNKRQINKKMKNPNSKCCRYGLWVLYLWVVFFIRFEEKKLGLQLESGTRDHLRSNIFLLLIIRLFMGRKQLQHKV